MKPNILYICGSLNQTTIMHSIAQEMPNSNAYYTPYYADGIIEWFRKKGLAEFSILGGEFRRQTEEYIKKNNLQYDYQGCGRKYDLIVTGSDLIVPKNTINSRLVLVQEGMTDPENAMYHIVKALGLPRFLASTSTTGLSDAYDVFCVASEGYKNHFIKKGVRPEKIAVTGIPNFDNCKQFVNNSFTHHGYVLVATSDARETFKYDNRRKFIEKCKEIANGRKLVFKLHPNENVERATREIHSIVPKALVFATGNTNEMIANCDVLITQYSSVVYIGIALEKEVYSYFDIDELRTLAPIQNGGTSSRAIASVCEKILTTNSQQEFSTIVEYKNVNESLEGNKSKKKSKSMLEFTK